MEVETRNLADQFANSLPVQNLDARFSFNKVVLHLSRCGLGLNKLQDLHVFMSVVCLSVPKESSLLLNESRLLQILQQ